MYVSRFEELNKNIEKVLYAIIDNQNLIKLINYNQYNPLSQPNISDGSDLLYKKVFPYRHIPTVSGTTDTANSLLTMSIRNIKSIKGNPYFKMSQITFYVLVHSELISTDDGMRHYRIMNELDKTFNEQNIAGIGKLEFAGADEIIMENYICYWMSYNICDFN